MVRRWLRSEAPRTTLSEHFHATEFTCHCDHCSEQQVDQELLDKLEELRRRAGCVIMVTSGYRCPAHQQKLRELGYETAMGPSQHELGRAADIAPVPKTKLPKLVEEARKLFRAVGEARSFVHVDLRTDKERNWSYKKRGS